MGQYLLLKDRFGLADYKLIRDYFVVLNKLSTSISEYWRNVG